MASSNIIGKKIVGFSIGEESFTLESMHEKLKRPEVLVGSTYKIKPPTAEYALYVTINDVVLNLGTEHESRLPYEIFINSKNMEHFQWVVALTRVISAIFRKGGNIGFLLEELKSVFDPKGGYYKKGGVYMPSLVAEIGYAIESHLKVATKISKEHEEHIVNKKKEYIEKHGEYDSDYPAQSVLCSKCNTKAVIKLDGCLTCLSCGDSKCG